MSVENLSLFGLCHKLLFKSTPPFETDQRWGKWLSVPAEEHRLRGFFWVFHHDFIISQYWFCHQFGWWVSASGTWYTKIIEIILDYFRSSWKLLSMYYWVLCILWLSFDVIHEIYNNPLSYRFDWVFSQVKCLILVSLPLCVINTCLCLI